MRTIILFLALSLFAGCAANVASDAYVSTIYVPKTASDVEIAIIRAATMCKWSAQKIGPSTLQIKRIHGKKQVIADVEFSAESYTIHHNSSTNMKYNGTENSISEEYFKWLDELDLAIQRELVM